MMLMKKKKLDLILLISTLSLIIFGIIMIYSASFVWAEYKFHDQFKFVKSQSVFFIIGIFLIMFFSKLDINFLKKKANLILFCCFILLLLVLIPGIGTIRNG